MDICFYVLAIVNNAAITIGVRVSFWIIVWVCASNGIPESYDNSTFSLFWGTSLLFSTVAAPIYISTNCVGGLPFFHALSSVCCV